MFVAAEPDRPRWHGKCARAGPSAGARPRAVGPQTRSGPRAALTLKHENRKALHPTRGSGQPQPHEPVAGRSALEKTGCLPSTQPRLLGWGLHRAVGPLRCWALTSSVSAHKMGSALREEPRRPEAAVRLPLAAQLSARSRAHGASTAREAGILGRRRTRSGSVPSQPTPLESSVFRFVCLFV